MSNNKRILHTVHIAFAIPYFIGDQYCYFSNKGYDVYLACSPSLEYDSYINDHKLKNKGVAIPILRKISILQDCASIFKLCKYIYTNHIDIVIGHSPKGGLLSMIAAFLMRREKRIYFRHGLVYETSSGIKRQVLLVIERLTAMFSTDVVCVSDSVLKQSVDDSLGSFSKLRILNRGSCAGVDTNRIFNPDRIDPLKLDKLRVSLGISSIDFVVGFCGRLTRDKGIDELLKSFKMLARDNGRSYKLLLVGDLDERVPLDPVLVKMIVDDPEVILTGLISKDIQYYYHLMNVFVLPSYREGFPVSTLEALSMRKPVITTRVTGCIDSIIEGETGFFVSHSPSEIASRILDLSLNPEMHNLMSNNARKFVVDNYSNEIVWSALIDLIQNKHSCI